ncbi:hypothetical protein RHSIM_Rhsim12G0124700 [Rhododendron simsii]|uniref:Protein NLRC3 n=1 Tax=Rhododendron simsii TaxID=118357 RepID=A0A834G1H6_RHOSS|nr:hypothetical protein RHSIM_Rhsim12G0124700 [Rhododendron simsii]
MFYDSCDSQISLEARIHRGETFRCSRSFRVLPGLFPAKALFVNRGRLKRLLLLRAASSSKGDVGPRRRVYTESQGQDPLPLGRVKEFAAFAVPAGAFLAITLGIKWSPGTSVLQGFGAKAGGEPRKRLNHFAKELRSSSRVDISGCNFGDDGLFFLAESLAYNQAAEEVNFAANGITAAGLKAFDGVLQSNMFLKTLDLSVNLIGDEGAKCLCDILVGNVGIQKLQLNSADLGDEGAKAIAEMLKKNSSLHVLELNNNMIDYSGFTSLAGALLENDSIQSLYLNGNYCGALGAAALAKGLEGNKSLREISLQGNFIGDEGVRALMSSLSLREGGLKHLDIGNNAITSKGAFHVAEYVRESKSLVFLNLSMNDIGDEGAEKIAEALKQHQSLANLDLGGNNIHAKGASAIAQILKENSIITKASLEISAMGDDGAFAIARALKANEDLLLLNFIWREILVSLMNLFNVKLKLTGKESLLPRPWDGINNDMLVCLSTRMGLARKALVPLNDGFQPTRMEGVYALVISLKHLPLAAVTYNKLLTGLFYSFGLCGVLVNFQSSDNFAAHNVDQNACSGLRTCIPLLIGGEWFHSCAMGSELETTMGTQMKNPIMGNSCVQHTES